MQQRYFKDTVCEIDSHIFLITPKAKSYLFHLISSSGFTTFLLNITFFFLISLFSFIDVCVIVIIVTGLQSSYRLHLMVLPGLCCKSLSFQIIYSFYYSYLVFQVGKFCNNSEKFKFYKLTLFNELYQFLLVLTFYRIKHYYFVFILPLINEGLLSLNVIFKIITNSL